MKSNLFKSAVLTGLVAVCMSSAQAVPVFSTISGSNVDFFYDTDFWVGSTASVSGNTLTFSNVQDVTVTAVGARRGITLNKLVFPANPGVIAVAASGYKVSSDVVLGVTGGYTLAATGGAAGIASSTTVFEGTYNNATQSFVHGNQIGGEIVATQGIASANNTASSGSFSATSSAPLTSGLSTVLGLDTNLTASAGQTGNHLESGSTMASVSYKFTTIQNSPPAVPEPETYAMMLAGLGLLGFAARRKKQA